MIKYLISQFFYKYNLSYVLFGVKYLSRQKWIFTVTGKE